MTFRSSSFLRPAPKIFLFAAWLHRRQSSLAMYNMTWLNDAFAVMEKGDNVTQNLLGVRTFHFGQNIC